MAKIRHVKPVQEAAPSAPALCPAPEEKALPPEVLAELPPVPEPMLAAAAPAEPVLLVSPVLLCGKAVGVGRICYKLQNHASPTHKSAATGEACPGCGAGPNVSCYRTRHPYA